MPVAMSQPTASSTVGLCVPCAHSRNIRSERGSSFWLCELAKSDARFRKYPQLPVRSCTGFSPKPEIGGRRDS